MLVVASPKTLYYVICNMKSSWKDLLDIMQTEKKKKKKKNIVKSLLIKIVDKN